MGDLELEVHGGDGQREVLTVGGRKVSGYEEVVREGTLVHVHACLSVFSVVGERRASSGRGGSLREAGNACLEDVDVSR